MTAPVPQNLYPSELLNAPLDAPSNYINLAAGQALQIPAQSNNYLLDLGNNLDLEYLDAVSGVWRPVANMSVRSGLQLMTSDGVTRRIANRLGCPVGAIVVAGGTGFVQSTATLSASTGGSTWQPIIGGALSVSTISAVGANYTVPPLVLIPTPTPAGYNGSVGGLAATAYAAISAGTISSVSLDNFGAGYISAPTPVLVPSPYDVNFGTITQGAVVFSLANTGAVTGALCTNFGAPLATLTNLTLTAAGGSGSGASIVPQILQTIVSASVVAGGAGWGTATAFAGVIPVGGGPVGTAGAGLSNPAIDMSGFKPTNLTAQGTTNAGGTITSVTFPDGNGLFLSAPTAAILSGGTLPTTLASIVFTMGTSRGLALIQPI
jgi:hypothetical protein